MDEKRPGPMVQETDFDPAVANAALRTAPEFEQEYWMRQARASIHREVLEAEGEIAPVPSAFNQGSTANGGQYVPWFPVHDCGSVASDAVSGNCGTTAYELIWLTCGGV